MPTLLLERFGCRTAVLAVRTFFCWTVYLCPPHLPRHSTHLYLYCSLDCCRFLHNACAAAVPLLPHTRSHLPTRPGGCYGEDVWFLLHHSAYILYARRITLPRFRITCGFILRLGCRMLFSRSLTHRAGSRLAFSSPHHALGSIRGVNKLFCYTGRCICLVVAAVVSRLFLPFHCCGGFKLPGLHSFLLLQHWLYSALVRRLRPCAALPRLFADGDAPASAYLFRVLDGRTGTILRYSVDADSILFCS